MNCMNLPTSHVSKNGVMPAGVALVITTARMVISVFLLAWFFLPNTFVASVSPGALFQLISTHTTYVIDHFLASVFLISVTVLFFCWTTLRSYTKFVKPRIPLWLPFTSLLVPMLSTFFLSSAYTDLKTAVATMMLAIATGLLSAWVAGSIRRASETICFVGLVQAIYTIWYQRTGFNSLLSGDVHRAGGTFNDPYGVCVLMLLVIPAATVTLISRTNKLPVSLLAMTSLTMAGAALVLTWTRSYIVAAAVALYWLFTRFSRLRSVSAGVTIVLFSICVVAVMHRSGSAIAQTSTERSNESRIVLWQDGIQIFRNNWLAGVGVGELNIKPRARQNTRPIVMNEPKNMILDWLDEYGLTGGIIFAMLIISIASIIRLASDRRYALGVAAGWIAFFIAGLADTPFVTVTHFSGDCAFGFLIGCTQLLLCRQVPMCASQTLGHPDLL